MWVFSCMDRALVSRGGEGPLHLVPRWDHVRVSSRQSVLGGWLSQADKAPLGASNSSSILHACMYVRLMHLNLCGGCRLGALEAVVVASIASCCCLLCRCRRWCGFWCVFCGAWHTGRVRQCRQALLTLKPHWSWSAVFRPPCTYEKCSCKRAVLHARGCSKPADCSSCQSAQAAWAYRVCTLVWPTVRLLRQSLAMRGGQPLWCRGTPVL